MLETDDQIHAAFIARRTREHLRIMPALLALILDRITPGRQSDGNAGSKPTKGNVAPPPLSLTALQDANDMYALLVNWATSHARALRVVPPGSAALYMDADRECRGFPSLRSRAIAVSLVRELADWLNGREEPISALDAGSEWQRDLDEQMRTWLARYPLEITEPTLPRPCPLCHHWGVVVAWSDEEGKYDEFELKCRRCDFIVPRPTYTRLLEGVAL